MQGVFELLPSNVHFKGIQLKTIFQRKTFFWIFLELRRLKPTIICDLHQVTRTRILDFLFRLTGVKVVTIDKERDKRRAFIKVRPLTRQKTTFERYAEVFIKAGFPLGIEYRNRFCLKPYDGAKEGVGIAPFAAHEAKILPLDKTEVLVEKISKDHPVYLFGSGDKERAILDRWGAKYENVYNMVGKAQDMVAELQFIAKLKLMVCMDSANMHLASLAGTRVISIWGATHPYAGFLGWGQDINDCIQLDMDCRPCSIYGNKPCSKGDYPCLKQMDVDRVYKRIIDAI